LIKLIPIPAKDANTVAHAIVEKFILTYGMMAWVKTVMGNEYLNEVFKEVFKMLKMRQKRGEKYN
jgi:hypothetical protein